MSQAFGISEFKPLSVGAIVSGAIQLYRVNFKQYFKIAFFAILWAFIPIYGWAKYVAELALISRLAFDEIRGRPEDLQATRRVTDQRKWKFLGAVLLFILIFALCYIAAVAVGFAMGFALASSGIAQDQNPIVLVLLALLFFLIGFSTFLWIATRFFIQDVVLAVEESLGAAGSLQRSWTLTKGSVFRLQLVLLVATLITGPFLIISQVASFAFQSLTGPDANPLVTVLLFLVLIAVTIANSALLSPFWQAIKALVYADLLTRREGVDLDLRGQ